MLLWPSNESHISKGIFAFQIKSVLGFIHDHSTSMHASKLPDLLSYTESSILLLPIVKGISIRITIIQHCIMTPPRIEHTSMAMTEWLFACVFVCVCVCVFVCLFVCLYRQFRLIT